MKTPEQNQKQKPEEETNPLIMALRSIYAPIVEKTKVWPPILAYGAPSIVAVLLIILIRKSLNENLFWLALVIILAPLVGYMVADWDKRHQETEIKLAKISSLIQISGNVLFEDGEPVVGATVFVEGIDRNKETDSTGWFQIEVRKQASWTVRAYLKGQSTNKNIQSKDVSKPVRLILSRPKYREEQRNEHDQKSEKRLSTDDKIVTHGDFSPGKVEGDYEVNINERK